MRLKDIGEFGFIERIKNGCLVRNRDLIKGIGDDCCVFRSSPGLLSLWTTDMLVEEVHFCRDTVPPYKLGRKSLAVNLSDIAAMGGVPKEVLVSIAAPAVLEVKYLDDFYQGLKSLAREFQVNVAGGDTTASPRLLVINVTMVGVASEEEILYRSGARPGDVVFLTGPLGSAAAGLDILRHQRAFPGAAELVEAHCNPWPQVRAGRVIAASKLASSLIDVSDGLAADLAHICAESKLGAEVKEEEIPTTNEFRDYCQRFQLEGRQFYLQGGEDYVLLGTVGADGSAALRAALEASGCQFFPVGKMTSAPGVRLRKADGSLEVIEARGWNHFA